MAEAVEQARQKLEAAQQSLEEGQDRIGSQKDALQNEMDGLQQELDAAIAAEQPTNNAITAISIIGGGLGAGLLGGYLVLLLVQKWGTLLEIFENVWLKGGLRHYNIR